MVHCLCAKVLTHVGESWRKGQNKVEGMESKWFGVRKGVRQGCTQSPWIFNVFMDNVVREARRECIREVVLSTGTVGLLMFADDVVMMAETEEALAA